MSQRQKEAARRRWKSAQLEKKCLNPPTPCGKPDRRETLDSIFEPAMQIPVSGKIEVAVPDGFYLGLTRDSTNKKAIELRERRAEVSSIRNSMFVNDTLNEKGN